MSNNLLIGVGGTGAKCVEATIHLCAAGLGPPLMSVGFVEPDQANGNLKRSRDTITAYMAARDGLRARGADNIASSPFLNTDFNLLGDRGVWNPVPSGVDTIRNLFNYNMMSEQSKLLFDSLFVKDASRPDLDEQDMDLGVGFRGRPAVGSAVIGATAGASTFWDEIVSKIEQGAGGDPIRIFLFGSIFGGTGASGFPVVARLIRNVLADQQIDGDSVKISGCLMLPYFTFPKPNKSGEEIAATADKFLEMTEGALDYYFQTLKNERVFDNLYILGWPQFFHLQSKPFLGGSEQVNPPLPPELFAGLASLHFFSGAAGDKDKIFHIEATDGKLGWADLPQVATHSPRNPPPFLSPKDALAWITRFSYAYTKAYHPALFGSRSKKYSGQTWFRRLFTKESVRITGAATQDKLKAVNEYCIRFLRWFATTSNPPADGHEELDLIDVGLLTTAAGIDTGDGLYPFNAEYGRRAMRDFANIIRGSETVDLHEIMNYITTAPVPPDAEGLGKFFSALAKSVQISEQVNKGDDNG